MKPRIYSGVFLLLTLFGCSDRQPLFEKLDSSETGIDFSNNIITNDSFNAILFEYIYNGGGLAASDLNGDGLKDLFFSGNQVSNRLYINRGGMRFEDVTERAGLETRSWCTGVAIADINNDGKKDIYVSVAGFKVPPADMENLLYINSGWDQSGVPAFTEMAAQYNLNDSGYSTQAAFLDYDLDGDLDMYLLTNALEKYSRNSLRPKRIYGEASSTDRLYRNNGDETFTDVSREAGILIEGYGLGVLVSDLNLDGYPDVYASNDFLSNDLLWINNRDGTFTNKAGEYLKHQTHNGMGVDIADFNNYALPDIAVLDMLPEDNYRQKMMLPFVKSDQSQLKRELGYQDQYMRNTIQLNQGSTFHGAPRFSEIGFLTGMASTDWSWAILFADFDNDGWKDAFITNGYRKDVTNLDYVEYSSFNQMFGTPDAKKQKAISSLDQIPDVKIPDYLFRNTGTLRFENLTTSWGLGEPSFSNGAVYADLDNDGDLDLAINNIDEEAFIYENTAVSNTSNNHYIQISLAENDPSLTIYNSKVFICTEDRIQYQELTPFRGYKSTVDDILHFGLGDVQKIDSIIIIWPNEMKAKEVDIDADQRITFTYEKDKSLRARLTKGIESNPLFQLVTNDFGLKFKHADNGYSDIAITKTLPHEHSKVGPGMAKGDINNDGFEDFFVGGNAGQPGSFFIQMQDGFQIQLLPYDSTRQDVDACLFDADNDHDLDLYVVSGGTFAPANAHEYQDRLYLNDGYGKFHPALNALPEIRSSGSCVKASDYDGDGDLDLFIGGRILPGAYPFAPQSYLLKNDNGIFKDGTPEYLRNIGLVTDALWSDFNNDGFTDLVIAGEWMEISFFKNENGRLSPASIYINEVPNESNGWWTHINSVDLDQDGDQDFLVGNLGLNSKLKASKEEPITIYTKDFDNNGQIDPLLSVFIQNDEYLLHERDLLIEQIPSMRRRFPNYSKYADAGFDQILTQEDLKDALVMKSYLFASIILENMGNESFKMHKLPLEAQIAPIFGSIFKDFNRDGTLDILTVGNYYPTELTQIGRYDASYGNLLLQTSLMEFENVNILQTGFQADGDVREIESVKLADGSTLLLVTEYGGYLKAYKFATKSPKQ